MRGHFRFVHLGVAGALVAAGITGLGLVREVGAAGSGTPSVFVPIVPCRLADTRGGTDHVGTRVAAIGQGESVTFAVWGANGNCTIPNVATGIATNVTAVHPTADSFVTIYPADATPRPTASNLNVTASSPPTPNQVTVGLSATGAISAYNNGGTLDLVIDIVGYYQPAGAGSVGPQGPQGPPGALVTGTMYFSGYDAVQQATNSANSVYYDDTECTVFQAAFQTAFMPLELPLGAQVTAVQVRYIDKSAGDLVMSLERTEPGVGTTLVQDLVTIGTNGIDYHRSGDYTLPTQPVVGTQSTYYIKVFSRTGTGPGAAAIPFCGATVTYTLPTT